MATITRKENGSWEARVRKAGYPTQCKRFKYKREAVDWANTVEAQIERGIHASIQSAEETTLAEALNRYAQEVTPLKKGHKEEQRKIASLLKEEMAQKPLGLLRAKDLAVWRDTQLGVYSVSTVRLKLYLISSVYEHARTEWGMEALLNPVRSMKFPSAAPGRDRRLTAEEYAKLLKQAAEYPYLPEWIEMAVETAMRRSELFYLKWADVADLIATLRDTKNGEQRIVPLSPRARQIIAELPREGARVWSVFESLNVVDHYFRRTVKNAGIENFRFHDLRHEATSRLFEKGFSTMDVSAITGHKTLAMLKRYTHLQAEDLAKRLG